MFNEYSDTPEPKYRLVLMCPIGLRVTSRRIGLPAIGEVRGAFLPFADSKAANELADLIAEWDAKYPDWRTKPVVFVAVELSEAEREDTGGDTLRLVAYPYDDLEVL